MLNLCRLMAGDFSNYKQASANPKDYAHIRIFFRPLPFEFFQGIGFYSEQTYDYSLWSPYRQAVHRLVDQGEQIYIENYSLKDSYLYAGAGHNIDILKTITPGCIQRRHNCSMVFRWEGDLFRGKVEGDKCMIEREGKQTYLVSEVELSDANWISWDRGLDPDTHEQIWGSTHGALIFEKKQSFAEEIPDFV